MSEDLSELKQMLERLRSDREKFELLAKAALDERSDQFARNALAGTNLMIGIIEQRIKNEEGS